MRYFIEHIGQVFHDTTYTSKEEVLADAKYIVNEYIGNHHRHNLPIKVERDEDFEPEVIVYELAEGNKLDLPLQEWVDEHYKQQKEYEEKSEEREYQRYLELKEKYEDN